MKLPEPDKNDPFAGMTPAEKMKDPRFLALIKQDQEANGDDGEHRAWLARLIKNEIARHEGLDGFEETDVSMSVELDIQADGMRNMSNEKLVAGFAKWNRLAPKTRTSYARHMNQFVRFLDDKKHLYEVTRSTVRNYAEMLENKRELNPKTIKAHLSAITSFYRWLAYKDADHAPANPATDIIRPRVTQQRGDTLTKDELFDLLHTITTPRDHIQTWLLAYTAARAGEIRNLRWRDIDFTNGLIHIDGKGNKLRTIPLHDALAPELQKWMNQQRAAAKGNTKLAAALNDPRTAFVLLTKNGTQIAEPELWRCLKARAAKAKIMLINDGKRYANGQLAPNRSAITPHMLRRTMATTLLRSGIELDAVADILGHKSVDTTRTHYAFSSTRRTTQAINAYNID